VRVGGDAAGPWKFLGTNGTLRVVGANQSAVPGGNPLSASRLPIYGPLEESTEFTDGSVLQQVYPIIGTFSGRSHHGHFLNLPLKVEVHCVFQEPNVTTMCDVHTP
jgi:hypothetical protein